jgi:hypothetical protein
MKSKQQKYEEAVARSMRNLKKVIASKFESSPCTLESVKYTLGIRAIDGTFDAQISALLPVPAKGKKVEKVALTLPS